MKKMWHTKSEESVERHLVRHLTANRIGVVGFATTHVDGR
jgi:hypothetical protein